MKELEVFYNTTEGLKPTQGYEDDFAYDMYASEGTLVSPLTFKSVIIPTDLKTAFDPIEAGMHVSLRSGAAFNTPLIMANSPGIIEGTYRNGIGIIVRNCFIDNSPVDFVFDIKGNRVPLSEVPNVVKKKARKLFDEENERLGYAPSASELGKAMFKTKVPRGTVYVAKHDRIAQMFFAPKYQAKFIEEQNLPETVRGTGGFGSSGSSKK